MVFAKLIHTNGLFSDQIFCYSEKKVLYFVEMVYGKSDSDGAAGAGGRPRVMTGSLSPSGTYGW